MIVTVTETVFVARPPDVVWDFTQDYARRREWDPSILEAEVIEAEVIETGATPRVRIRAAGGLSGVFQYKLFDRPRRTSLVLTDVESALIRGGGGSWSYEAADGGTQWTQTNSLKLRGGFLAWPLAPIVRGNMRKATRRAMLSAKRMLEEQRSR